MKFCSLALFVAAFALPFDMAVADLMPNGVRSLKKADDSAVRGANTKKRTSTARGGRELKTGKDRGSSSSGDAEAACPSCSEQLPGYSFFGQNYLQKDFWKKLFDGDYRPDAGFDPEFGRDYLTPGPFGFSTDGVTCYDNLNNRFFCGFAVLLSELIYQNDLIRCLLMSIATTIRDLECLDEPVIRRRLFGKEHRALAEETTGGLANVDIVLAIPGLMGVGSLEDLMKMLGVDPDLLSGLPLPAVPAAARQLKKSPEVRASGDTAEDIINDVTDGFYDTIFEDLYKDPDVALAVTGNLFFVKCLAETGDDLGLCAGLFAVLKTLDASVCYYREELQCGEATCTKDLKFDVDYTAERLFVDLPLALDYEGLIAADILAPCGACIIEKSDGCAPFCNFYQSYHECDNIRTAYLKARVDQVDIVDIAVQNFIAGREYFTGGTR